MAAEQGKATPHRVVVGVDGSPQSERALRWGRFVAEGTGATLVALMSWQPLVEWMPIMPEELAGGWQEETKARDLVAQTTAHALGGDVPEGMTYEVGRGSAAKVLIDASREASMVVLGSRGRGGFSGLLLGSVSSTVSSHAHCPVLIVHGEQEPPGAPR